MVGWLTSSTPIFALLFVAHVTNHKDYQSSNHQHYVQGRKLEERVKMSLTLAVISI